VNLNFSGSVALEMIFPMKKLFSYCFPMSFYVNLNFSGAEVFKKKMFPIYIRDESAYH
jgi:hypothetical protein